jgi:hypothetical protein
VTPPKPAAKKPEVSAETKAIGQGVVGPAASAPAKPASSGPARAAATTAAHLPAARAPQRAARTQTRSRVNALVTPEHYAYVRNDLIRTGVLATAMFLIIVIAYFVLHARGLA